jgi:hypothetical protein
LGKVVFLNNVTSIDLPADRVIENAIGKLKSVVIIGYTEDGEEEYFASSIADGGTVLWLMERTKQALLNVEV